MEYSDVAQQLADLREALGTPERSGLRELKYRMDGLYSRLGRKDPGARDAALKFVGEALRVLLGLVEEANERAKKATNRSIRLEGELAKERNNPAEPYVDDLLRPRSRGENPAAKELKRQKGAGPYVADLLG